MPEAVADSEELEGVDDRSLVAVESASTHVTEN
jgi:hypothetical protein